MLTEPDELLVELKNSRPFEARQLLLDDRGDRALDDVGAGARIVGIDGHRRRRDLRIRLHRQLPAWRDAPPSTMRIAMTHANTGPLDEERCHAPA